MLKKLAICAFGLFLASIAKAEIPDIVSDPATREVVEYLDQKVTKNGTDIANLSAAVASTSTILGIANGGTGAKTAASARTNLGAVGTDGTSATGTWPISITGNANTATTAITATNNVLKAGDTMTGQLNVSSNVVVLSSITANSFFGDGLNIKNAYTFNTDNKIGLIYKPHCSMVPMYVYPSGEGIADYEKLISLKLQYPEIVIYTILNVDSGPGATIDSAYAQIIPKLHGAGIKVIGYVYTSYGGTFSWDGSTQTLAGAKAAVDKWSDWYDVDGIFMDEFGYADVGSESSVINFYKELNAYIHTKGLYPSIGNPGWQLDENLYDRSVADNLVLWENSEYPSVMPPNTNNTSYFRRSAMVSGVEYSSSTIATMADNYFCVWVTSIAAGGPPTWQPNPYGQESPYLDMLFSQLSVFKKKGSNSYDGYEYRLNGDKFIALSRQPTDSDNYNSTLSLGINAGYSTAADSNTFVGNWAGYSNVWGEDNTYIGFSAGKNESMGSLNTLMGSHAGESITDGFANTYIGAFAGNKSTSSFEATMIGVKAGSQNMASVNTFIGAYAGSSTVTGDGNTFIGGNSGTSNTVGFSNVFIGSLSGMNNIDGTSNVFIGHESGLSNTEGYSNTYIGDWTGVVNSTGMGNTFIGAAAGATNRGQDNVFIGAGADQSDPWSSGIINIGNALYGNVYDKSIAINNQVVRYGANFEVNGKAVITKQLGIAVPDLPAYPLDVIGTIRVSSNAYIATTAANRVGIGNSAPAYKLDVTGGIRATSTMTASAFYGNGATLTGVITSTAAIVQSTGTIYAELISTANALTAETAARIQADTEIMISTGAIENAKVDRAGDIMTGNLIVGASVQANIFIGDGSLLTGITAEAIGGDNLGNHIATTTLRLGGFDINTSSGITGLQRIVWADGTIQVSSPIAGGSSGGGDVYLSANQELTGNNIFSGTTTIRKLPVITANTGTTLTSADSGATITVSSNTAQIINLPSVSYTDIGIWFTIVKLGTGTVTVHCADSDTLADSTAGGNVYNSATNETYANITVRLVTESKWVITSGDGNWTTN